MIPFYFKAAIGTSMLGVAVVLYLLQRISSIPVNDKDAARVAESIRKGAMTFLREEYSIIVVVAAVVAALGGYFTGEMDLQVAISTTITGLSVIFLRFGIEKNK